ncbi:MAG: class II D-tagatose-bisphosphate aldolase, non-catalytic subunit [Desulfobacterales bacterium]|nr:class II D-tagatose-bisphosphate aldolase, non-catalytic subunit [Desulfobacterales bacterium]
MPDYLRELVAVHKRGERVGLTSVCSANQVVVEATLEHAKKRNLVVCLESTGRQVNQCGGYVGMQPKQFGEYVKRTAEVAKLRNDQVILGGDHLGPDAWRCETSDVAMSKAHELIRQCVRAGYRKLHLDPSMPCRDDVCNGRPHLSVEMIAERTASLCESAEEAATMGPGNETRLVYVVGTDVPLPGGQREAKSTMSATSVRDVEETISQMRRAFAERGLESAWSRCVALVVQTGVTFDPEVVWDYDSRKTKDLKTFIQGDENLVFEAHSTDFQTQEALTNMVRDHFAILKVGPWLTFATREALYALAYIEREWLRGRRGAIPSRLPEVMQDLMRIDQTHFRDHYRGNESYLRYITVYGFSDRVRYYWSNPRATEAVEKLVHNMTRYGIPLPLLSQYMPTQYEAVREGRLQCIPRRLVDSKVFEILDKYAEACGDSIYRIE